MNLHRLFTVVVLGLSAVVGWAEPVPRLPLETFFDDLAFDDIIVSPDGKQVAALSRWKGFLNLYVIDIATKKPRQLTGLTTMDVADVRWVGNNRLVFTGVEEGYGTGGLFAIDADGGRSRALAQSVKQQAGKGKLVYRHTEYLGRCGKSEDEILVVSNERRELDPDVYRMNVHSGVKQIAARNPGGVQGWLADWTGAVRIGYGEEGRDKFMVYRDGATGEFREIWRGDFSKGTITPVAFEADNHRLYVASNIGRDTAAICLFDLATGQVGPPLYGDATYDVEEVRQSSATGRLLGYAYEAERTRYVWIDPALVRLQTMLDQELPGMLNEVVSTSLDHTWVVVLSWSDRDPGTYYMLNTRELTMEKLVRRTDRVDPRQMAEMKPVQYQARDGRTIHGYLTLPVGLEAKNLPMVVNPHGGPWARDTWGYDSQVQFLANRGYAVLQMDFRGSTGYGRSHLEAGYGQWGLAMQDDITDGVKWAVEQGIVDPRRVAIFGGSYGGYAAMAGAAFTPDLYRCAVNYVGVTDIGLLLDTIPKAWEAGRAQLEAMAGDKKKDRERLEATSIIKNADKIKIPVFFVYGELDDRIDMHHATRLATQLRRNGVPVRWMVRADEGHGYRRRENRLAFEKELEEFLGENMGQFPPLKVLEMPVGTPVKD